MKKKYFGEKLCCEHILFRRINRNRKNNLLKERNCHLFSFFFFFISYYIKYIQFEHKNVFKISYVIFPTFYLYIFYWVLLIKFSKTWILLGKLGISELTSKIYNFFYKLINRILKIINKYILNFFKIYKAKNINLSNFRISRKLEEISAKYNSFTIY